MRQCLHGRLVIDLKRKVIYTHPQKSGGTSIESMFENSKLTNKHDSLTKHIEALESRGLSHEEFFKFSTTRNPWASVVSHYFFDKKHIEENREKLRGNKRYDRIAEQDFTDYVRAKMFHGGDASFFMYHKGEFALDKVIHFDDLQGGFNEVCQTIGMISFQLPHVNKTSHKHYSEYYNDELREIVGGSYALDIEMFGYTF